MAEKRGSNDSYFITNDNGVSFPSGNDSKGISIAVNIDCNEALIGLKAITREAKKATAALKELEEQQSSKTVNITHNVNVSNESGIQKVAKELHELTIRTHRNTGVR